MKTPYRSQSLASATETNKFLWFMSIAYLTQGVAQHFCLIAQPLEYFMLKALSKNAASVASLLTVLFIPWMIKPVYGVFSDLFPLAGYRRKSYLALSYATGGVFYIITALTGNFAALVAALFVTAMSMAAGTAVACGLTLERGRPAQRTRSFQSLQAICYYTASILSFLLGGLLCSDLLPAQALSAAAAIAAVPCFITAAAAWYLVVEEKSAGRPMAIASLTTTVRALRNSGIASVALFMCCWKFSPGFGTPLYFHETKVLGFSQLLIGQLGAINSIGMIVGAFLFWRFVDKKFSPRSQAVLAVVAGTVSTAAYLLLSTPETAVLLEFVRGLANILAIATVYGLVADVSPRKLESTTMAILIAASNIAEQGGNLLGAHLYTYSFQESFAELIVVSALANLGCVVVVPFLPQEDRHLD